MSVRDGSIQKYAGSATTAKKNVCLERETL